MKTKICLVSLLTLLLTIGMYQGWLLTSHATPTAPNAWTSAYAGAAFPASASLATLTIPPGSNRLLVVAVASTRTAVGAVTITNNAGTTAPAFGGKTMTLATGDAGSATTWNHSALYYLKEADIAAASGAALDLKIAGGTSYYNYVYYRVYTGVDQSTVFSDAKNYNIATANATVGPFSPTLTVNANDQAVEVINLSRSATGTTARTISTWATGWTTAGIQPAAVVTGGPCAQLYIRDRAVPATLTNDGSSHTASGNTMDSMTAMSLKSAPATTTLTVSANTPLATGSKLDTDSGVVMQRVTVTATGQIELNSLRLDDTGTADNIQAAEIYIAPDLQTTLPATAVLIGGSTVDGMPSWSGSSTLFNLTGGTQADRTIPAGATRYLYIVYDMAIGQATKTVQSKIIDVGVVAPNIGATGVNLSSNLLTLARSGNMVSIGDHAAVATTAKNSGYNVIMQRFKVDCDVFADNALELDSITIQALGTLPQPASVDGVKVYISASATETADSLLINAKLLGSIQEWNKSTATIMFTDESGAEAIDRTVIAGTSKYIYLTYDMFYLDSYNPAPGDPNFPLLPISPTEHIGSKITALGVKSPDTGLSSLTYASNDVVLTRGVFSKITTCGGCHDTANIFDGTSRNVPDGKFVGSHRKHTNELGRDCLDCHGKPALTAFNHANGFINFSGSNFIKNGKYSRAPSDKVKVNNDAYTFGSCSGLTNTACHNNGAGGTNNPGDTRTLGTVTTLPWGSTGTCWGCHGTSSTQGAPDYVNQATTWGAAKANSHDGATHKAKTCNVCHSSVATVGLGIYSTNSQHGNGTYSVNFGYVYSVSGGTCSTTGAGCHDSTTIKWGTVLGCIDCHNSAKGNRRVITTEFGLAWGHKKSGRTAVTSADCVVCHLEGDSVTKKTTTLHNDANFEVNLRDPDGATAATQITRVSNGTAFAFKRFSTTYAPGSRFYNGQTLDTIDNVITQKFCLKCHDSNGATNSGARVTGGTATNPWNDGATVIDVSSQFNTTNSSWHPVKGPRNKDFPTPAKLNAPYNNFTRVGTSGTKTNGVVINCFDCHNDATTPFTRRTVTAHGYGSTIRGTINVASPTLCIKCHAGYTTAPGHGTGSAYTITSTSMTTTEQNLCSNCHSSLTASVRPVRAQDVHGVNALPTSGSQTKTLRWLAGGTQGVPIAFIRNTSILANHNPKNIAGTGYTAQCSMGSTCGSRAGSPYTPGGTY